MSTLMFWNKQNNAANQGNEKNEKNGKKSWLHTPDVLVNGHVAYPVKVSCVTSFCCFCFCVLIELKINFDFL